MAVVLRTEQVAGLLSTGASARVGATIPSSYKPGDVIRARNIHPTGHTRLPRYIRGKLGVVERDFGVFVLPDSNAHGKGPLPQHLYCVRFEGRELWGEDGGARDAVFITLFNDYIEAAPTHVN